MKTVLFVIVLLIAPLTFALDVNEPANPIDSNDIAVLQAKIAVLEKTIEQKNQLIAKLKKELAQMRKGFDPNSPQQSSANSMTTFFKLPLVVGRTYRLGGDNRLIVSEIFKDGTFIASLETSGKTANVWVESLNSLKPKVGMNIKYDSHLVVTGTKIYNRNRLYVIEPR